MIFKTLFSYRENSTAHVRGFTTLTSIVRLNLCRLLCSGSMVSVVKTTCVHALVKQHDWAIIFPVWLWQHRWLAVGERGGKCGILASQISPLKMIRVICLYNSRTSLFRLKRDDVHFYVKERVWFKFVDYWNLPTPELRHCCFPWQVFSVLSSLYRLHQLWGTWV